MHASGARAGTGCQWWRCAHRTLRASCSVGRSASAQIAAACWLGRRCQRSSAGPLPFVYASCALEAAAATTTTAGGGATYESRSDIQKSSSPMTATRRRRQHFDNNNNAIGSRRCLIGLVQLAGSLSPSRSGSPPLLCLTGSRARASWTSATDMLL